MKNTPKRENSSIKNMDTEILLNDPILAYNTIFSSIYKI